MVKLIDLNYYAHLDLTEPSEVLQLQSASIGYADHFKELGQIQLVKHMSKETACLINGVQFNFFKRSNRSWQIPIKTHRFVRSQDQGIVLVQGLIFPLQVIYLRKTLGKKVKIIVQHHGEKPGGTLRIWLQKKADPYIDAYLFTSLGNADNWIDQRIISKKEKCFEVLEASTGFKARDKKKCRAGLNISEAIVFLWVGRLIPGKDPLLVLRAFEKLSAMDPAARLYMIFQTNELLEEVKELISNSDVLRESVILRGFTPAAELEAWYSAADYFISGSHAEGSGYALLEAMACGCVPIVTDIPSFKKICNNGKIGYSFTPGDEHALTNILLGLNLKDQPLISAAALAHFKDSLSFKAIAESLCNVCRQVKGE